MKDKIDRLEEKISNLETIKGKVALGLMSYPNVRYELSEAKLELEREYRKLRNKLKG